MVMISKNTAGFAIIKTCFKHNTSHYDSAQNDYPGKKKFHRRYDGILF